MGSTSESFECVVCRRAICPADLIIDRKFLQLLHKYPNDSSCIIKADGTTFSEGAGQSQKRKIEDTSFDFDAMIEAQVNGGTSIIGKVTGFDSYVRNENGLSSELCKASVNNELVLVGKTRRVKVDGVEKEIPHIDLD
jgi:hypothetical protein